MATRPVVLCASAHAILEDRLGNICCVLGLASARLLTATGDARRRELVIIIRRAARQLEEIHRGLYPCRQCGGCGPGSQAKGLLLDETA